jgi:CheY-like chemotaxis protein
VVNRSVDHFAAINLDINMPIMDGYKAASRIDDYISVNSNLVKPWLYALTADVSDDAAISDEFDHCFHKLDNAVEVQMILHEINSVE